MKRKQEKILQQQLKNEATNYVPTTHRTQSPNPKPEPEPYKYTLNFSPPQTLTKVSRFRQNRARATKKKDDTDTGSSSVRNSSKDDTRSEVRQKGPLLRTKNRTGKTKGSKGAASRPRGTELKSQSACSPRVELLTFLFLSFVVFIVVCR
jgi:hypothetical protein